MLFVLAIMAVGWLAVHEINTGGSSDFDGAPIVEQELLANTLTLPAGKLNAAKFESERIQAQRMQQVHTIPGRIRYDETRHVDVKAPIDGILAEVLVTPGDRVVDGQLLGVVRSPEIGRARAEILKQKKERDIAQQVMLRESLISKNLDVLTRMLGEGKSVELIGEAFSNRDLGSYRQGLLSSYAKLQLAEELLSKVKPLSDSGAVSGRLIREREATRQLAETSFRSARDQATFDAEQARVRAEARLSEADRQLNLAWQALETLLGYQEDKSTVNLSDDEALSRLEIRAPFAGSVESRGFANNERVSRGDSIVVLANTETLYVAANIRENDWSAVALKHGTPISVVVPALEDRTFEAKVRYFGREVEANTNSIPLVATINNAEGLLRPGMFVRVTAPAGTPRDVLAVRSESVVRHEDQQFVFLDLEGGMFKRVDVATGQATADWIEVTEGLTPGQRVVTTGAFLLKSELLLQGEGD